MQSNNQQNRPIWSWFLVVAQFSLIGALLWALPLHIEPFIIPLQIIAALLGLWALKTMRLGDFNIIPDPKPNTELISHGPYRWVRHPMYLSIILFFLPMVLFNPSWGNITLFFSLTMTLLIKLNYEEKLLLKVLPGYRQYCRSTKRLLPFLF